MGNGVTMSEYNPESWVIIKIINDKTDQDDLKVLYKVFGSWRGNFVNSDSWRLNSGITKVEEQENCYIFYGASGSAYHCYKTGEGRPMGSYNTGVLGQLMNQLNNKDGITAEVVKAKEIQL